MFHGRKLSMKSVIEKQITELLKQIGVEGDVEFSTPPKPEMGDFAYGCFALAKKEGKNPVEVAESLKSKVISRKSEIIDDVKVVGPYVNFFLNGAVIAEMVLKEIKENDSGYGTQDIGKGKRAMIEFGCPNPLKVFHLGHLKNLITGEAVVRMYENAGYEVVRVNYQGDVGMHQAKAMWAIDSHKSKVISLNSAPLTERVAWLGEMYAEGASAFENDEKAKEEIVEMNRKIYEKDSSIWETFQAVRQWSLDYFDTIYTKLGSHFDKLYFESDSFEPGMALVQDALEKGILTKSDGAVIFEGSKHGLHDRVFLNSKGFPTYEGKELGLAQLHHTEFNLDKVVHVVGKEQKGYFEVVFKALEHILPETAGKEMHLPGGYLQLKGGKKMSSRTGSVIAGDELLAMVEEKVREIMKDSAVDKKEETVQKVTAAVLKYAMLKADVSQDVGFDMEESVSTSGDSGPYLLYIVARIKSILNKSEYRISKSETIVPEGVESAEKQLVLKLAAYPVATSRAFAEQDPSVVAKYLFDLAQRFNSFYTQCPVLKAEAPTQAFRLQLISAVELVMTRGLSLLGIETLEEM